MTFAYFWPDVVETVVGISISVALTPPTVLLGLGLSTLDYQHMITSSIIVGINIVGIYLGTLFMFAGLYFFSKD